MNTLGVFAKFWDPGKVKTRLAKSIGGAIAARLHYSFLRTVLLRFADQADRRVLVYSPADRREDFAVLAGDSWQLEPQGEGELGHRMESFFARQHTSSERRTVVLGSDSPNLPRERVRQAFDRLADHSVVLGPSDDGGYYLLGLRGGVPPIFDDIAWGTSQVWSQTLTRLEAAGTSVSTLPPWYDVDEPHDLARLRCDLQGDQTEPELAALSATVEQVLCKRG